MESLSRLGQKKLSDGSGDKHGFGTRCYTFRATIFAAPGFRRKIINSVRWMCRGENSDSFDGEPAVLSLRAR